MIDGLYDCEAEWAQTEIGKLFYAYERATSFAEAAEAAEAATGEGFFNAGTARADKAWAKQRDARAAFLAALSVPATEGKRMMAPLDHAYNALNSSVSGFYSEMIQRGIKELPARQWAEEFRSWLDPHKFGDDYERTAKWLKEHGDE